MVLSWWLFLVVLGYLTKLYLQDIGSGSPEMP